MASGQPVRWADVAFDETQQAVKVRREMEDLFRAADGAGHTAPAAA